MQQRKIRDKFEIFNINKGIIQGMITLYNPSWTVRCQYNRIFLKNTPSRFTGRTPILVALELLLVAIFKHKLELPLLGQVSIGLDHRRWVLGSSVYGHRVELHEINVVHISG